jgi:hypothetical protein
MALGVTNRIRVGQATAEGGSMLGKGSSGKGMEMNPAKAVGDSGGIDKVGRTKSATVESYTKGSEGPQREKQNHTISKKTENTVAEPQTANKIKRNY